MKRYLIGWGFLMGLASLACVVDDDLECVRPPEVSVSLSEDHENVRTLPVIASGKTRLLGQDLADSHGDLVAALAVQGVDEVDIDELAFEVEIEGAPQTITIVRQLSNGQEVDSHARLSDGQGLRTFFKQRQLADILQPEGKPYRATLTAKWSKQFPGHCPSSREGIEELVFESHIAPPVETGSFEVLDLEPNAAEVPATVGLNGKFRLFAEITSGLTADIQGARAEVTYLGSGELVAGLGLLSVENPAITVDGAKATRVAPGQKVEIYTSNDLAADPPPHTAAGTGATTGTITTGKALITVYLDYEVVDGTPGVHTDVLVHAVDL